MNSLKELCHRILTTSLSNRQIGESLSISHNTVARYRSRLAEEGMKSEDVIGLDAAALDRRLNTGRSLRLKTFVNPDWTDIDREMRKVGVTLRLLHEEYVDSLASGAMSESEFRRRYDKHRRAHGLVMRQIHPPGESLFIDFSGKRPTITDQATGLKTPVELFVAASGASRKTFALATASQKLSDFIDAHVQAMQFFGGSTAYWVPDNLKSAVSKRTKEEGALINTTYSECARHYCALVLPARPHKPKDKATVEVAVLVAQRWILARLRNRVFNSLAELNAAIRELVDTLNERPMRSCGDKTRNQLFEDLDRPALKPLPQQAYEFADWQLNVRVGQDYHVTTEGHYYSVPFHLVGSKVNVRVSHREVVVFHRDRRVASHPRSHEVGGWSTRDEHRPTAHRMFAADKPAALVSWVTAQGGSVQQFFESHVERHRQPMLSVRACQGLRRLAEQYGLPRLHAACARAIASGAASVQSVDSMLRRGLESAPLAISQAANDTPLPTHENVRGAEYFHPSDEGE
jgi:transposase